MVALSVISVTSASTTEDSNLIYVIIGAFVVLLLMAGSSGNFAAKKKYCPFCGGKINYDSIPLGIYSTSYPLSNRSDGKQPPMIQPLKQPPMEQPFNQPSIIQPLKQPPMGQPFNQPRTTYPRHDNKEENLPVVRNNGKMYCPHCKQML